MSHLVVILVTVISCVISSVVIGEMWYRRRVRRARRLQPIEPWRGDVFTVGQLRAFLSQLPDEAVVLGEFEDELMFNELSDIKILPAGAYVVRLEDTEPYVQEMPPAVLLYGGQIVNAEYALDVRYDQQFLDGIQ